MDIIDELTNPLADDRGWWDIPFDHSGIEVNLSIKVDKGILKIIHPDGSMYTLLDIDVVLACILKAKEVDKERRT